MLFISIKTTTLGSILPAINFIPMYIYTVQYVRYFFSP